MERSPHVTSGQRLIRLFCLCPCSFLIEGDNSIERGVVSGNLRQMRFQHLGGGYLTLADTGRQFLGGCEDEVVHKLLSIIVCINSQIDETANVAPQPPRPKRVLSGSVATARGPRSAWRR